MKPECTKCRRAHGFRLVKLSPAPFCCLSNDRQPIDPDSTHARATASQHFCQPRHTAPAGRGSSTPKRGSFLALGLGFLGRRCKSAAASMGGRVQGGSSHTRRKYEVVIYVPSLFGMKVTTKGSAAARGLVQPKPGFLKNTNLVFRKTPRKNPAGGTGSGQTKTAAFSATAYRGIFSCSARVSSPSATSFS